MSVTAKGRSVGMAAATSAFKAAGADASALSSPCTCAGSGRASDEDAASACTDRPARTAAPAKTGSTKERGIGILKTSSWRGSRIAKRATMERGGALASTGRPKQAADGFRTTMRLWNQMVSVSSAP
jgi:hypothetical protein